MVAADLVEVEEVVGEADLVAGEEAEEAIGVDLEEEDEVDSVVIGAAEVDEVHFFSAITLTC